MALLIQVVKNLNTSHNYFVYNVSMKIIGLPYAEQLQDGAPKCQ